MKLFHVRLKYWPIETVGLFPPVLLNASAVLPENNQNRTPENTQKDNNKTRETTIKCAANFDHSDVESHDKCNSNWMQLNATESNEFKK